MNRHQLLTTAAFLDVLFYVAGCTSLSTTLSAVAVAGLVLTLWLAVILYEDANDMEFVGFIGALVVMIPRKFSLAPIPASK